MRRRGQGNFSGRRQSAVYRVSLGMKRQREGCLQNDSWPIYTLKLHFFSATVPWHALFSHLAKSAVSGHAQYMLLGFIPLGFAEQPMLARLSFWLPQELPQQHSA